MHGCYRLFFFDRFSYAAESLRIALFIAYGKRPAANLQYAAIWPDYAIAQPDESLLLPSLAAHPIFYSLLHFRPVLGMNALDP